jgi:plastocyanin
MTDTTPDEPTADGTEDAGTAATTQTAVEPVPAATPEPAHAHGADERSHEALETRLLIPLLLPVLAIIAVALYAINVSRVFLAGDSTSALVIATIITILILVGGAIISATPGARTSSLAMVVGLVVIIVISAGLLALGPSIDTGQGQVSTQTAQCKAPTSTVNIEALASIRYSQSNYDAAAGCVEFKFSGATGHTMQFRKLDVKGFPIGSVGGGTPTSGNVELKPGTYDVYCTIDEHAAQGMVAPITVSAAAPATS